MHIQWRIYILYGCMLNSWKAYLPYAMAPTGALTSKPYVFGYRPWESKTQEVFDPKLEFYQPILITVVNNRIHRVLPVNKDASSEILGFYNWIPNKLRFFFESLNFDAGQFCPKYKNTSFKEGPDGVIGFSQAAVSANWLYLIKSLSSKLSNFSRFHKIFTQFGRPHNFDFHAMFQLDRFFASMPNLIKMDLGLTTSVPASICLPLAKLSLMKTSKILLISFNPHFVSPNFSNLLKSRVDLSLLEVYTMFFSYFSITLKAKNAVPNINNLVALFSGRHSWSRFISEESVTVVFDYNFLCNLPKHVQFLIFNFFIYSNTGGNKNFFIANRPAFHSVDAFPSLSSGNGVPFSSGSLSPATVRATYNNFCSVFQSYFRFNARVSRKGADISFKTPTRLLRPDDVEDWFYLFKPVVSIFSEFSVPGGSDMDYFFPTASFTEFTAKYNVFEFPGKYLETPVSAYRQSGRPTLQMIYFFHTYFSRSWDYSHLPPLELLFFFIFSLVFVFQSCYKCNCDYSRLWHMFLGGFVTAVVCDSRQIRFYPKLALENLTFSHGINQFFLSSVKKMMLINSGRPVIFSTAQTDNFVNDYRNSSVDLAADYQVEYSKTLTLNRQFFNLRFKNFSC